MKSRTTFVFLFLFVIFLCNSQPLNIKGKQGGLFSLGTRTTTSFFNHNSIGASGLGIGGQFRIQLADRLNTEWFSDYMRSTVDGVANRTDYHIGWSVMYYFTDRTTPRIKPYILAGHCFDGTEIQDNRNPSNRISKLSSAIQAGAGVHFNLTERMDLTLITQYMFHLGADVHAELEDDGHLHLEKHKGTGIEGHLLVTLGINYKIIDLWYGNKKKN